VFSLEFIMFAHQMGDYSGPIHVRSGVLGSAQCVRQQDGRFHVFQRGTFSELLNGPGYLLASFLVADVLRRECGPSLKIVPADVIDVATERTLANYYELSPGEEVTPETISNIEASGNRAWHFHRSHLFVSKSVAIELQRTVSGHLRLTAGFSDFCGGVASAE
jgi:hypothetical protein